MYCYHFHTIKFFAKYPCLCALLSPSISISNLVIHKVNFFIERRYKILKLNITISNSWDLKLL